MRRPKLSAKLKIIGPTAFDTAVIDSMSEYTFPCSAAPMSSQAAAGAACQSCRHGADSSRPLATQPNE